MKNYMGRYGPMLVFFKYLLVKMRAEYIKNRKEGVTVLSKIGNTRKIIGRIKKDLFVLISKR